MFILNYGNLIDPLLKDLRRFTVEFSGLKAGDSVVDICCGTGAQVLEFAQHGVIATGIDNSESMLEIAARNEIKKKTANVTFHKADATDLPFPDDYFDNATISFGLHDKEGPVRLQVVSEMVRTVRRGGILVLMDFQVPLPRNKWAILAGTLERVVGGSHYRGFKDYVSSGGLRSIVDNYSLKEVNTAYPLGGLLFAVKIVNR